MNSIQASIDSLVAVWQENSPASRIGLLLLAAIFVIAIGGIGYWSMQPSYVVLVSEQEGEKVDKVIDALDRAGIAYQISGAGGNVMVDQRNYAKAKLLVKKTGGGGDDPFSAGGLGGAFASPTERRNRTRLQKERSLANTITKMTAVDHADVHLNIPNKGPFERKTAAASASVLLTLRHGENLSEGQAMTIASFVAFAVEDLEPASVQITDKNGRSYTLPNEQVHQINSQVEYLADAERKLARKAEDQLLHFLGFGNASVQVSLDLTFKNGSTKTTKYDPDGKVAEEEDLETETSTSSEPENGAAGIASNLQTRSRGSSAVDTKREVINSKYLVPVTEETVSHTTPVRNHMSVSVLVNSETPVAKQEDGTLAAGLAAQVEAIVRNAVGFQEATDAISVEFLPFPSAVEAEVVAAPFDWAPITNIVKNASLAIAAGLALVLALMLIRRVAPRPSETDSDVNVGLDPSRVENMNQLSKMIKDNPEALSEVIRMWAGIDDSKESSIRDAA